jgi:dephospho-CoA kinase
LAYKPLLKIGLTGGIGCGKTTVSELFAELNAPVIDADNIAHELVQPGQEALDEIAQTFGKGILDQNGSLNRARLREIVFSEPGQKLMLEAILHPRVFATIQEKMLHIDTPYCILSIPLLFETKKADFVDRILVVDCPVELQIMRVKQRDHITNERIQSIIDSQVTRDYRLRNADDVIDNTLTPSELAERVKKLHNFYLSISAS